MTTWQPGDPLYPKPDETTHVTCGCGTSWTDPEGESLPCPSCGSGKATPDDH